MLNALTIDVEDYFHVAAFRHQIRRSEWESFPLRVEENTHRILDHLDRAQVHATFFVLGWVARKTPHLVKEIARRGHEVACHGCGHQLIYEIGPEGFRADLRQSKPRLEDLCGQAVIGYRAPSYSITSRSLWALDILIEEGFLYDSSIYPVYHDLYGIPGAERHPHRIRRSAGNLYEFPISTLEVTWGGGRYRLPVGGGGYLRLLPLKLIRYAFEQINRRERQPAVLYFHPWEIDPGQPRIRAPLRSRFRHYVGLEGMERKVLQLLKDFRFAPMQEVLEFRPSPAEGLCAVGEPRIRGAEQCLR